MRILIHIQQGNARDCEESSVSLSSCDQPVPDWVLTEEMKELWQCYYGDRGGNYPDNWLWCITITIITRYRGIPCHSLARTRDAGPVSLSWWRLILGLTCIYSVCKKENSSNPRFWFEVFSAVKERERQETSGADEGQLAGIFPARTGVRYRYHYDPYHQYLHCDKIIINTLHRAWFSPERSTLSSLNDPFLAYD